MFDAKALESLSVAQSMEHTLDLGKTLKEVTRPEDLIAGIALALSQILKHQRDIAEGAGLEECEPSLSTLTSFQQVLSDMRDVVCDAYEHIVVPREIAQHRDESIAELEETIKRIESGLRIFEAMPYENADQIREICTFFYEHPLYVDDTFALPSANLFTDQRYAKSAAKFANNFPEERKGAMTVLRERVEHDRKLLRTIRDLQLATASTHTTP